MGILISIPKDKTDVSPNKLDKFRGITLSPVISKIFEVSLNAAFGKPYLSSLNSQFDFKNAPMQYLR